VPDEVASRAISSSTPVAPAATAARASNTTTTSRSTPLTYRVKRGDTLSSIARLFDTTVDKLKSLNRLRDTRITPGDRLTIRAR
jgi:LysM repeat protein